MRTSDFDYELPPEQIAQHPAERRELSRLLVVDRAAGSLEHRVFADLADLPSPGDVLVLNETRVFPARLRGKRAGGGAAEILLLRPAAVPGDWTALVRPGAKLGVGKRVEVGDDLSVEIVGVDENGDRRVRLHGPLAAEDAIERYGEIPLPPYMRRQAGEADRERYQTVYATTPGSVAAPTAGLHFTPELLARLEDDGVRRASVTLHVGLDTFRPLEGEYVDEHRIHREWCEVPAATRRAMSAARRAGGRVVAVGTTSVRVLETAARWRHASGWSDLYITPPHDFAAVDALLTNFHLPRSSLLLLVTGFVQAGMAGSSPYQARDTLLAAYMAALRNGYRFFSFGDAMLIV